MEKLQIGSVTLFRFKCPLCEEYTLTDNPNGKCDYCEKGSKKKVTRVRKIGEPKHRRTYSKALISHMVEMQSGLCYWCGREFGVPYMRGFRFEKLRPVGDHRIPYVYCQTTTRKNLVVSCNLCNLFKSSKMFRNDDEVRGYLKRRWEEKMVSGSLMVIEE